MHAVPLQLQSGQGALHPAEKFLQALLEGAGLLGRGRVAGAELLDAALHLLEDLLDLHQALLGALDDLLVLLDLGETALDVPDDVVQAGGLGCGPVHDLALLLHGACLLGDVVGEGIQGLEMLLDPPGDLLDLAQLRHRRLHLGQPLAGVVDLFEKLARGLADVLHPAELPLPLLPGPLLLLSLRLEAGRQRPGHLLQPGDA